MKRLSRNNRKDVTPPRATSRPGQGPTEAQVRAIRNEVHRSEAAIHKALFNFLVTSARARRFWAQRPLDGQKPVAQTSAISDEVIYNLASRVMEHNTGIVLLLAEHFMEVALLPLLHKAPRVPAKTSAVRPGRPGTPR